MVQQRPRQKKLWSTKKDINLKNKYTGVPVDGSQYTWGEPMHQEVVDASECPFRVRDIIQTYKTLKIEEEKKCSSEHWPELIAKRRTKTKTP